MSASTEPSARCPTGLQVRQGRRTIRISGSAGLGRRRPVHGHPRRDRRQRRIALAAREVHRLDERCAVGHQPLYALAWHRHAALRIPRRPLRHQAYLHFRISSVRTGSALAGLAPSLPLLIAARAVQGIGGGIALPLARRCCSQPFPRTNAASPMASSASCWSSRQPQARYLAVGSSITASSPGSSSSICRLVSPAS